MPDIEATIVEREIPPLKAQITINEFSGHQATGEIVFNEEDRAQLELTRKTSDYLLYIWPTNPDVAPESGVVDLPEYLEDSIGHRIIINGAQSGPIRMNTHSRRGTLQEDGTYSFEPNYLMEIVVADMVNEEGDKVFMALGGLARWERDALQRLRREDFDSAQLYRQWVADGREGSPPVNL